MSTLKTTKKIKALEGRCLKAERIARSLALALQSAASTFTIMSEATWMQDPSLVYVKGLCVAEATHYNHIATQAVTELEEPC